MCTFLFRNLLKDLKNISLARMEAFYSSISILSILLVFELLISFFNVCIFTDYVK